MLSHRPKHLHATVLWACVSFAPAPVGAADFDLGLGWSGLGDDDGTVIIVAEAASGIVRALGPVELRAGAAASLDGDGAMWGGVGPIIGLALGPAWRIEGSVMPGLYAKGNGTDLGGFIQFRSRIAIIHLLGGGYRLGVAVTHMSNAGIEAHNPGEDAAFLFAGISF